MTDEYYMLRALREAQKAYDAGEVPVGAVIVLDNHIISRGHNQVEKLTDATAHAEIIALTSAFNHLGSKYLPNASIYITVEPCLMCAGALYWSKISRVVYGTADEKNGYRKYTSLAAPTDPSRFGPSPIGPSGLGPSHNDPSHAEPASAHSAGALATAWPFHPKTELVSGVLKDECARLMKDFFRSKR
ncbi:MAG: nucleoside deaminase [Puia sp.]|nr:nucleoside deaminase [Puia sp.]